MAYKYVMIKSSLGEDSYLDIRGANKDAGTEVITWSRHGKDNQVWYVDAANHRIRSKMNDFCLEFQPGTNKVIVTPYNPHNTYQTWSVSLPRIKLQPDNRYTLSVVDDNSSKGASVSALHEKNTSGQSWVFEDAGGSAPIPSNYNPSGTSNPKDTKYDSREFMIKSQMPGDLVLDIKGDNDKAGATLIVYTINKKKNQLWYKGHDGFIRSCLNDMVFHGDKKGHSLEMAHYTGDARHQWRVSGNQIINGEGRCLDIRGGKGKKCDELCAYDYKGQENQHWTIVYS